MAAASDTESWPGPSDEMLTPRGKIRALMAQLDNSDDDGGVSITHRSLFGGPKSPSRGVPSESSDSESESYDITLPRGKLARRMLADQTKCGVQVETSVASSKESAYARIRDEMRLQTQQAPQVQAGQSHHEDASNRTWGNKSLTTVPEMTRVLFNKKKESHAGSSKTVPTTGSAAALQKLDDQDSSDAFLATTLEDNAKPAGPDSHTAATAGDRSNLLALVQKKRAEREARELAQNKALKELQERVQRSVGHVDATFVADDGADAEDVHGTEILASQTRPTRKASKKALEEMTRETQKMSRNMQLAHRAEVRKKFSVNDLLKRFNYSPFVIEARQAGSTRRATPSLSDTPPRSSDTEIDQQTPLTSPIQLAESAQKHPNEQVPADNTIKDPPVYLADEEHLDEDRLEEELPTLVTTGRRNEHGASNRSAATASMATHGPASDNDTGIAWSKNFRVRTSRDIAGLDSDSDLDIEPANPLIAKLDRVFSYVPAKRQDSDGRIKLKALAHLASPSRKNQRSKHSTIPIGQMYAELQKRARQQAAVERHERVEELKAKGIIIQTAEERESEQIETENLLERARKEVEELTRRERKEKRNERGDEGSDSHADVELSDDESYDGSDNQSGNGTDNGEEADDEAVEDSSSEGDDDLAAIDEDEEGLTDATAGRTALMKLSSTISADRVEHGTRVAVQIRSRQGRRQRILDDDEDDALAEAKMQDVTFADTPKPPRSTSSILINPFAKANQSFVLGGAPLALSQAFAATMDDSQQLQDDESTPLSTAVSAPVPEPDLPIVDHARLKFEYDSIAPAAFGFLAQDTPLPAPVSPSNQSEGSQSSEMPEPTQDAGIAATSPLARRFVSVPPSTVDTMPLTTPGITETVRPKRKLLRRREAQKDQTDDTANSSLHDRALLSLPSPSNGVDAFVAMADAQQRRAKLESFDKARSGAKEMIEEQAEESEDEYAGLGGASDDESGGELDDDTREMLDDGKVDVDESRLAAFHADRERAANEKEIEKLYKDVTSGGLRRKRGDIDGFADLTDSDEEYERRRKVKQNEHARIRKALLADEGVGRIAENPKKAAFLKAIEDREDGEEQLLAFLGEEEEHSSLAMEDSLQEVPNSQPEADTEMSIEISGVKEKRKRPFEEADPNARPPAAARRTKTGHRKHLTMADIRESVSFLVEEPHLRGVVQVKATQSPDSDEDIPTESALASRRIPSAIVDRLVLRRAESAETTSTASGRLAFVPGQGGQAFQVPSLLRRATTQNTGGSEVTYVAERALGSKNRKEGEHIRRGGTRKSNVAYFAREAERRKAVEKVERRRDIERKRMTEKRRGILQGIGGGTFE